MDIVRRACFLPSSQFLSLQGVNRPLKPIDAYRGSQAFLTLYTDN